MTAFGRAPARRDGARRRDALLDAAVRCFRAKGVQATRIEDIRKEAGASPSSFYHQFRGVSDLTLALLVRTFRRLFAHLADRAAAAETAHELVVGMVDGHIEWVAAHPDEAAVMYQAMSLGFSSTDAETLAAEKAAALAPVMEKFGTVVAAGELPPAPVLELEIILLGPTHEACRRWLMGAPLELEWMRSRLPALAWSSLFALEGSGHGP